MIQAPAHYENLKITDRKSFITFAPDVRPGRPQHGPEQDVLPDPRECRHLLVPVSPRGSEVLQPRSSREGSPPGRYFTGNTKGGGITVPLTSCLTGLETAVRQLTIFVFMYKTG